MVVGGAGSGRHHCCWAIINHANTKNGHGVDDHGGGGGVSGTGHC